MMVRRGTTVMLLGLAGILLVLWAVTLTFSRPLHWENHERFLKPGHWSISLGPGGLCLAFTDEVDTNRASSWDIIVCRVTVLDVYEHVVGEGATATVMAPRTILFYLHFPFIMGLLLAYPGYRTARAGLRYLAGKAGACRDCGYDLTGNTSGVCPECGTEVSVTQHAQQIPWQRGKAVFFTRWTLFALALAVVWVTLLGYTKVTSGWICTGCARTEYRVHHRFILPFTRKTLFELNGGSRSNQSRSETLTPILDPEGTCQHNWVCFGDSGKGLRYRWRGIGVNPAIGTHLPDLAAFLDDHPEALNRIRADLRQRHHVGQWFDEAYIAWRQQQLKTDVSP